jgi:lysine 6-dehydrogenase
MTIAVLGGGIVGTAAAWDLVRRGYEVVVADSDPNLAGRIEAEAGASFRTIDAGDPAAVRDFLESSAAVVSAVPYALGELVAAAAIETHTHYFDFGGNPTIVRRQLELGSAARAAGVAVVPDCGLAPGVANVLAAAAVASLGTAAEVRLRVGALPQVPVGTLGYQLAFNPEGLINEYDEPCDVLAGGVHTTVEPLTGFEAVEWDRWGPLEAFHTAGGSSSLPTRWEGEVADLDYKTLRFPGHGAVFAAMRELGLFERAPQSLGGETVSPRAVLLDTLLRNLPSGADDLVLVRVWATGGDPARTVGWQIEDVPDGRFSALARTTAFPATALADLIVRGVVGTTGAVTMDGAVTADELMPELAPVGIIAQPWPPTR